MKITLGRYVACICEGAAEQAVIELLLDGEKLIFPRTRLLDEEIIRTRSARQFEERYLRKGFDGKITVLRILDSRRESFTLSKAYAGKVDVVNVITAPEIEMLIIFSEGRYEEYRKSGLKPSDFCKSALQHHNVKSSAFVKSHFCDINRLIAAIQTYRSKSNIRKGEYSLADLLK
ncbi:MAG: hypothetical protein Q4F74_05605 [Synergistaceae bacterium]|nr:hypothetical protein [Synergistaceae bacterium]